MVKATVPANAQDPPREPESKRWRRQERARREDERREQAGQRIQGRILLFVCIEEGLTKGFSYLRGMPADKHQSAATSKRRGEGSAFKREGREGSLCICGRGRGVTIEGTKVGWAEKDIDSRRLSMPIIKVSNKKTHE